MPRTESGFPSFLPDLALDNLTFFVYPGRIASSPNGR